MTTLEFFFILVVLPFGIIVGYYFRKIIVSKRALSAELKVEKIISEAKAKQKEILYQAREKALKLLSEAEKEEQGRRKELNYLQQILKA